MKFIHISDLHLGKQLHGYSLIEDQKHVLRQIIAEMEKEEPEDVYKRQDMAEHTFHIGLQYFRQVMADIFHSGVSQEKFQIPAVQRKDQ